MPKRLIDDSLLNSPSLEVLSPRTQDAFPRFILLADDFGCFEVEPRPLWARGWPKRTDVTEQDVSGWISEMAERQAVGFDGKKAPPLLMLWSQAGRRYAYLTGWNGPHGQKQRAEYDANAPVGTPGRHGSKRKTPKPPADLLADVMAGNVRAIDGKPPGTDREETGNDEQEKPNEIVPARETHDSRSDRDREMTGKAAFPGPVVPVVVPDPVADPPLALEPPKPKAKSETDPRFAPLRAAWEAAFLRERGEPYRWLGPKDATAVHRLIAIPVPEFEERALRGLRGSYRQRCSSVAELSMKWNDLAGTGPPGAKQVTAAASERTKFGKGEVAL